ncbi:hypothetical protein H0H92_016115 [Tricholoma furcatifolium]|nr:hypothetical protein H0H92_016115 [Tricholoma furcatifolium]
MSTVTTTVDDRDPNIQYAGPWVLGGTEFEYDGTTHGTSTVGAQAAYTFTGSLIEVFGTIGMENNGDPSFAATSSYTVDGGSTVAFTGAVENVTLYKQLFFTSQPLGAGQHTLVISYVTAGKNPLWLDYFQVVDSVADTASTSSSSTLSTTTSFLTSSQSSSTSLSATSTESSTFPSSSVSTATASSSLLLTSSIQSSSAIATSTSTVISSAEPTQSAHKSSGLSAGTIGAPPQISELQPFDPYATPSTSSRYYYQVPTSEKASAAYENKS